MTAKKPISQNEILALVLGSIIIVLILLVSFLPYGRLRMTYDSHDLIEASKSLETYLTAKNSDGHSYLVRAPLHPFLLSFFQNKMLAMWWINVLSLFASILMIYRICREKGFSDKGAMAVMATTVLFYPWMMNFQFFWTEPIFIFLILCLSYSFLRNYHLLLILQICVLLFFTRKAGIFFFVAGALVYAADKKWVNAGILFISGIILFACWQWLEFVYESTGYFGVMLGTLDPYSRIFYLDAVSSWIFPTVIPLTFRITLAGLALIIVAYSFRHVLFAQLRQRQNVVLLSLAGAYTLIFVSFSGASGYEDAERYLNVVFPLWIILAVSVGSQIISASSKNLRIFLMLATMLWVSYTFWRTVHHLA